jgi:hypothetical protein
MEFLARIEMVLANFNLGKLVFGWPKILWGILAVTNWVLVE